MTSGLETEFDYSGRKGRDGQKKKIGKANERKWKGKRWGSKWMRGKEECPGPTPGRGDCRWLIITWPGVAVTAIVITIICKVPCHCHRQPVSHGWISRVYVADDVADVRLHQSIISSHRFLAGLPWHTPWGARAPLFPPCPFTSSSFPLFTLPFLSLALPIFFFWPSLPFLPE